jgi:hypothetical protein
MDNGRFIWCRNCGAIHHVSAFDRSPVYHVAAGEVQEEQIDDWRDFMDCHAGHRLEPLRSTGNMICPRGSAGDPMNIAYLHVTDGKQTVLLRRSRPSIDKPFAYEIVDGSLLQTDIRVEIQADAIRKEMQLHFSWAPAMPLSDEQINFFIALFAQVVQSVDPVTLSASEYSGSDDQTSYCKLPQAVIDELMEKSRDYYSPIQLAALRHFAEGHRDGGDVMALVKRSTIVFAQTA